MRGSSEVGVLAPAGGFPFDQPSAGGFQGKHIVEQLLKGGKHHITAITREDSQNSQPSGVTVKKVNYDDHAGLVAAMQGHDILIITMNVLAPPESEQKLLTAAFEAKIPWIIPNEWGSDTNSKGSKDALIGYSKEKTRARIEASGVSSWTATDNGFWYEFSLPGEALRFGFDFPNKKLLYYEDGREKIDVSTWPQVGRAVAAMLSLPVLPKDEHDRSLTLSHYRNKFAHIKSFTVDQRDMFASVLRVTGDKESDWTIEHGSSREAHQRGHEQLKAGDRKGFGLLLYARAFFPEDPMRNPAKSAPDSDNVKLGLPQEDLDEFTALGLKLKAEGKLYG